MVVIKGRIQNIKAVNENNKLFILTCLIFLHEMKVRMILIKKTRTIPQNINPRLSILLNPPPIMIPKMIIKLNGIDMTDNIDNIRAIDILFMCL